MPVKNRHLISSSVDESPSIEILLSSGGFEKYYGNVSKINDKMGSNNGTPSSKVAKKLYYSPLNEDTTDPHNVLDQSWRMKLEKSNLV